MHTHTHTHTQGFQEKSVVLMESSSWDNLHRYNQT